MEAKNSQRLDRALQTIGGLLLAVVGWISVNGLDAIAETQKAVEANARDIVEIKASRHTAADARADSQKTADAILAVWKEVAAIKETVASMPKDTPPPWLKDQIEANRRLLEAITQRMAALERAVDRLDQRGKPN